MGGGHSGDGTEHTAEIVEVQNAAVLCHGLDLQRGIFQKMFCQPDPPVVYIGGITLPRFFSEQTREVVGTDITIGRDGLQTQIVGQIVFNPDHGFLYYGGEPCDTVLLDQPAIGSDYD